MLCEALFGELFRMFRAPNSMRDKSSRDLPEASEGLPGPSGGFLRLCREKINFYVFHIFSMKVQHKIFFVMGEEAKFLTTLSETSSGKRRLHFEPLPSRQSYLERHSTLGEGFISLLLS